MEITAFDRAYVARRSVFGDEPDRVLQDLVTRHELSGLALDLGAGEGRNSLWLARHGFGVEALDVSLPAILELGGLAREASLPVTARQSDVSDLTALAGPFDLVVADTVLCHLPRPELAAVAQRIMGAMSPGAWLYASAFADDDPQESEFSPLVHTYFGQDELCDLFAGLAPVVCANVRLTDRRHGPPHRHSLLQLVARKEGDGERNR